MKRILIFLILIFTVGCSSTTSEVVFFKIGQADSALVSINNKIVLIDTGEEDDSEEIIDYLKSKNIDTIDYLLISHYDKDHVGGASKIVDEVNVLNVYGPDYEETSVYYSNFESSLKNKNLELKKLNKDLAIKEIGLNIYTSPVTEYEKDAENNMSLIFKLTDQNVSYLFLGDIEFERINMILKQYWNATLVKMPHHGKVEDNTFDLVSKIYPSIAVITSSDKNMEDEEVLDILRTNNIETFITRNGNIYCTSNGEKLSCKQ